MKALVFERAGEPEQVLQLRDVASAEPGAGEVRVRMTASPINPSDLLYVRGSYGPVTRSPATPGFEGVGVIESAGPGLLKRVRGSRPGRRVAVLGGTSGTWQQSVVISARRVVPIPDDIADDQAASFFVNPATVLAMIRHVLRVRPGDWLLQTAAASALGKMIIRLGRHQGFHTINIVRRPDQVEELRRLGGDEVLADHESAAERVTNLTQGRRVPFALDAVGGAMGQSALRCLGEGGRLLVYGALSGEPIPVEPRQLIGGQIRVEGFWLAQWAPAQGAVTMLKLFREIIALMRAGILITPAAASYPLADIKSAVRAAETPGRAGKILLKM